MVWVVGGGGFLDVGQPIVVVYGEGVVEVGRVMKGGRRVGGSGSGVFWVSSHL